MGRDGSQAKPGPGGAAVGRLEPGWRRHKRGSLGGGLQGQAACGSGAVSCLPPQYLQVCRSASGGIPGRLEKLVSALRLVWHFRLTGGGGSLLNSSFSLMMLEGNKWMA